MATTTRNRAGYGLLRSAGEAGLQLGRLVAGSEGTLAIVLQAVLRTIPVPVAQGTAVLPFRGLSEAAAFVPELIGGGLEASSCDLFDRRSISLARDADPSCRGWIDEAAEAILIVEMEGDDPEQVASKIRLLGDLAGRGKALIAAPFSTFKRAECERLLGLRRLLEPLLMRLRGRARPISFIDDVAVPTERLAAVLPRLQNVFQQQNVTWTIDSLCRRRPAAAPPVPRPRRSRRSGQARTARRARSRHRHRGGEERSRAHTAVGWSARSFSANSMASSFRSFAKSRMRSTRKTSLIPGRSLATIRT